MLAIVLPIYAQAISLILYSIPGITDTVFISVEVTFLLYENYTQSSPFVPNEHISVMHDDIFSKLETQSQNALLMSSNHVTLRSDNHTCHHRSIIVTADFLKIILQ